MNHLEGRKDAFSLISILLSFTIIAILYYFFMDNMFNKPVVNNQTKEMMTEVGINASSNISVLESTKAKIHEMERQQFTFEENRLGNYLEGTKKK